MANCFCLNKSLFEKQYSKIVGDGYLAEKTRQHVVEHTSEPLRSLEDLADSSTESYVEYLCSPYSSKPLCAVSQMSALMTHSKLLSAFEKLFNPCSCEK